MFANHRKVGLLGPAVLAALSCLMLSIDALSQVQPGLDAAPVQSVSAPDRIHPALLQRLEDEGEPVKAWVLLADKGIHSAEELAAALQQVEQSYNGRARLRRMLRAQNELRGGALFDMRDLPVCSAYVEAVAATGADVRVISRWLNAVSAQVTRAQLEQLAELSFVQRLQPVARARRIVPENTMPLDEGPFPPVVRNGVDYGLAAPQLDQIRVTALHEAGFTGQGVIVGILDTGFRRGHVAFGHAEHPLTVVAEYDFINDDGNTDIEPGDDPDQHFHGTAILGTLAAYAPGAFIGGAYDASFILCKTEDVTDEYPGEEDNYVAGLEFIEANGGDVVTASLSYIDWYTQDDLDGATAVTTIAVNTATYNGVHCCNAASNMGHDDNPATAHLGAPADAWEVITCGAADGSGLIADFSSDGPTADGRVKPELLARGVYTWTIGQYADDGYTIASGTSLSTPLVAGAVACLVQAEPQWSVGEMRDKLFRTADDYVRTGNVDPLFVRGFGVLNAYAPLEDCNANCTPDLIDIVDGPSEDCTGNGIPDECEPDCNINEVADSCDIADGTSQDCNGNGIPDECDLDTGSSDCNSNGVPDECELEENWPLLEQPPTGTSFILAQSLADAGMPNYDVKLWDDFTLDETTRLGQGQAWFMPGWGGHGAIPFLVEVADVVGGAEVGGNVLLTTMGCGERDSGLVRWHFDGAQLPPGTYWLSVQALGGFIDYGLVYWQQSNASGPNGSEHYFHNPGDGFGFGSDPFPASWLTGVPADLALILNEWADRDINDNQVPDECEESWGDMNCDGVTNDDDVDPFVWALWDRAEYESRYPDCDWHDADCNGDGAVDFGDINPFAALLGY